jgi:hypothetical protein
MHSVGAVVGGWLFYKLPRAPAHFPEVNLKPGRFLEDREQLGFARRCDIKTGEPFQVGPRLRRNFLIWRTGVLACSARLTGAPG